MDSGSTSQAAGHDSSGEVTQAVSQVGSHPVVENGARVGYAVNGLLHLVIAWIGVQLALGSARETADQSGALQTLAGTTLGALALWIGVVGFALLALWQFTEVFVLRETADRVKSAAKAVLYAVLGYSCLATLRGGASDSSAQTSDVTAELLNRPFGTALVVAVGLGIVGVGAYHVHKGWARRFLRDLREHPGGAVVAAGRFGYFAKGVALGIVGVLFVLAALHQRPDESTGLDGAMRALLQLPFGRIALALVALGFAAFAVYSFGRAKYARV